jgi:hypothetical protein
MGDWDRIQEAVLNSQSDLPIQLNCFYQDETLQWIENMKCTPWQADPASKTLRA